MSDAYTNTMEEMLKADRRMKELEAEMQPIRSNLSWLERQWVHAKRDSDRFYSILLRSKS